MVSHPMWVRGLKRDISKCFTTESDVAPYVGAWIETRNCYRNTLPALSHPMWVRGLKHVRQIFANILAVAPYVGAWIETVFERVRSYQHYVAPYVGAWIETK